MDSDYYFGCLGGEIRSFLADQHAMKYLQTRVILGSDLSQDDDTPDLEGKAFFAEPFVGGPVRLFDRTPLGELLILREIFRHDSVSAVVSVLTEQGSHFSLQQSEKSDRQFIVKYSNDCGVRLNSPLSVGASDPLSREFKFLRALEGTDLVPTPRFISENLQVDYRATVDLPFVDGFMRRNMQKCIQAKTRVRMLVIEPYGPTLGEYLQHLYRSEPNHSNYMKKILILAGKTIALLSELHSYGIMHNDVHADSVAFKNPIRSFAEVDLENVELIMINLHQAKFFPAELNKPYKESKIPDGLPSNLMSVFQLNGFRSGPRDDIYRIFAMVSAALSRGHYLHGAQRLVLANLESLGNPPPGTRGFIDIEREVFRFIRNREPLFVRSIPLASNAFVGSNIEATEALSIVGKLEAIVNHIKKYCSPDSVPDYEYIVSELREIISRLP